VETEFWNQLSGKNAILDMVISVMPGLAVTSVAISSTEERSADLVCHVFVCQDAQGEELTKENVFDLVYHTRSEEALASNLVDDKEKDFAMVSVIVFPDFKC
jgi:hypothetical protein